MKSSSIQVGDLIIVEKVSGVSWLLAAAAWARGRGASLAPTSRIPMRRVIRVSGGGTGRLLSGILPRSFAWGETSLSHETHTHTQTIFSWFLCAS